MLASAQEGIAYEDSVFVPRVGKWPDLRSDEQAVFMTSWCHGAPGIALGRIGGLALLDSDDIRRDIEIAVQTMRAAPVQGVDHLRCGNLGRADVLLVAASKLARPELALLASRQAWQVVTKAEQTGCFCCTRCCRWGCTAPVSSRVRLALVLNCCGSRIQLGCRQCCCGSKAVNAPFEGVRWHRPSSLRTDPPDGPPSPDGTPTSSRLNSTRTCRPPKTQPVAREAALALSQTRTLAFPSVTPTV